MSSSFHDEGLQLVLAAETRGHVRMGVEQVLLHPLVGAERLLTHRTKARSRKKFRFKELFYYAQIIQTIYVGAWGQFFYFGDCGQARLV